MCLCINYNHCNKLAHRCIYKYSCINNVIRAKNHEVINILAEQGIKQTKPPDVQNGEFTMTDPNVTVAQLYNYIGHFSLQAQCVC